MNFIARYIIDNPNKDVRKCRYDHTDECIFSHPGPFKEFDQATLATLIAMFYGKQNIKFPACQHYLHDRCKIKDCGFLHIEFPNKTPRKIVMLCYDNHKLINQEKLFTEMCAANSSWITEIATCISNIKPDFDFSHINKLGIFPRRYVISDFISRLHEYKTAPKSKKPDINIIINDFFHLNEEDSRKILMNLLLE